jgi:hypothetical protein
MTVTPPIPRPRHARLGANPTLEMLEYIRAAMAAAGGPISRNRLLGVLASWGHMTSRRSLNAALAFFADDGIVAEDTGGLIWVPTARANAPAQGRGSRSG